MRFLTAYILSLLLTLSSFALAEARGAFHDLGTDIVICSGVGLKTITIGPDGTPQETIEVCPDGYSILADGLPLPAVNAPELRLVAHVPPAQLWTFVSRSELAPSARGPPRLS